MKNRKSHICLIIIVLATAVGMQLTRTAAAQLADTTRYIAEDGWIEKIKTNIGVKISLDNRYETFKVTTETNEIDLYPNITSVLQLGLSYRFIRLSIGYAPKFLPGNGDEETKGKTNAIGFNLAMFTRHWFQELGYSKVRGYYLFNTNDYIAWNPGDPYIQFPDLQYLGFFGATGYSFNPRLSLKAMTLQTERQLKSTGGFIAILNYRYYITDDQSEISPGRATQRSDNIEVGIGPGYVYTFVLKEQFYASVAVMPSFSFIHTKLTLRTLDDTFESNQRNPAFRYEGRGSIGYNGHGFFGGFYIDYAGMTYNQEGTTAVNHNDRMFYQFFVGFRIKAPRGMNRFFDKF